MQGLLQLKVPRNLSVGVWRLEQHPQKKSAMSTASEYQSTCVDQKVALKLGWVARWWTWSAPVTVAEMPNKKKRVLQVTCTSSAIASTLGFEELEAWLLHKTHRSTFSRSSLAFLWVIYHHEVYIHFNQNHGENPIENSTNNHNNLQKNYKSLKLSSTTLPETNLAA